MPGQRDKHQPEVRTSDAASDIRVTREALAAEVESLRRVKSQLENEIAERQRQIAPENRSEGLTLRAIFDATLDGIVVLKLSRPKDGSAEEPQPDGIVAMPGGIVGRYVDINRGFEKQFGFTPEEVIGKTFGELNMWADGKARDQLLRELSGKGSINNLEAELRTKDGRTIPCLLSGAVVTIAGELYAVGMARDITELKETQRKLQESEETFRTIFDANLDRMTIVDLQTGKFIDVNNEFMRRSGFTREEIVGKSSRTYTRWQNPEEALKFAAALREHGEVRNMDVNFLDKDGVPQPCLISGTLLNLHGHVCCLTITRDISELKEAERQLIEAREAAVMASRAKSEFLSSMSHEIRTPMNAVLGMADLLAETRLEPDQRKYLDTMINNGNALLDLINDILDLAKVEAGRLELDKTAFDLADLTDRVCETLAIRAHTKRLELASHLLPEVPVNLIGDPLRLRQVLINLIGNSIKFTESGSIVVTVEKESSENSRMVLHFSVTDTGIGIAPDQIDRIFGSFTQADSSTTRKYGGTGLGLAIVKRLVELMGGKIWVESELGKGSIFHFTSVFEMQDAPAQRAESSAAAPLDLSGVRTLIVDDTPVNRVILREMLGARGAVITEAENGEQALSKFDEALKAGKPFELLVLDCRMPGMDGLELAGRVKSRAGGCRIITLMLTSDDFSVRSTRLQELGIQAYLVKPIRRPDLYEAIANAMAEVSGSPKSAARPARSRAAAATTPSAGPGIRILLAEDSADNRLLIQAYLKSSPHKLETAENGEIAVNKFKTGRFDMILMDMQMPVMDGYTAVREIRKWQSEQGARRVPIVALTASALKEDVRRSLESGCDAHIPKPVKKATVLAAIQDVAKQLTAASEQPADHAFPSVAGVGFFVADTKHYN